MGGENLAVAQNTYAVSWFKGRELNMVFGLQLSFSRVVHHFCFILLVSRVYYKNSFSLFVCICLEMSEMCLEFCNLVTVVIFWRNYKCHHYLSLSGSKY